MATLVECVPNFSEGRDRSIIDAIAAAISSVAGVMLLDVDPGADTNRTVYTFVGPPDAVSEAALTAARRAADLIDMTRHQGEHPRIGALAVCPIVPVSDVTMDECMAIAQALDKKIVEYAVRAQGRRESAEGAPDSTQLLPARSGALSLERFVDMYVESGGGYQWLDPHFMINNGDGTFTVDYKMTIIPTNRA